MQLQIDQDLFEIEIIKKRTTKNTYLRVKEGGRIVVTTNSLTTNKQIEKIIQENLSSLKKMLIHNQKKEAYQEKFHYLGKEYDIVYNHSREISLGEEKVFIGREVNLDRALKKVAEPLFRERLEFLHHNFSRRIPYPTLSIRKMKSRWGVCNVKDKHITLNLELIKRDPSCLDYVIIHELSHLIYPDHSKLFWKLVEENYPEYKKIRKQMKEY